MTFAMLQEQQEQCSEHIFHEVIKVLLHHPNVPFHRCPAKVTALVIIEEFNKKRELSFPKTLLFHCKLIKTESESIMKVSGPYKTTPESGQE